MRRVLLVLLVLAGWFTQSQLTDEPSSPPTPSGMRERALTELPPEATATWQLIEQGGPFPHPEDDGKVFGNREGLLPDQDRGYYHEYTVETPGSPDRGARRIVTGDAGEHFYTGDHYESFDLIDLAAAPTP